MSQLSMERTPRNTYISTMTLSFKNFVSKNEWLKQLITTQGEHRNIKQINWHFEPCCTRYCRPHAFLLNLFYRMPSRDPQIPFRTSLVWCGWDWSSQHPTHPTARMNSKITLAILIIQDFLIFCRRLATWFLGANHWCFADEEATEHTTTTRNCACHYKFKQVQNRNRKTLNTYQVTS